MNLYLFSFIFNTLSNDKFFYWTKSKADDEIYVTEPLTIVLWRVENILWKGENADYQNFLLFPECVQRGSFSRKLIFVIAG